MQQTLKKRVKIYDYYYYYVNKFKGGCMQICGSGDIDW